MFEVRVANGATSDDDEEEAPVGDAVENDTDRPDRVCVVGAGPSGLALARALLHAGIDFDVHERHTDVGGIWDQANPGSPVYDSAHFISSKKQSHYHDFWMPDDYPDYPSHHQILAYIQAFADTYGLRSHIRFGNGVVATERVDDGWLVTTADGRQRRYRELVCATGTTWAPSMPDYPGTFTGEIRHSSTYRSPAEMAGRRVLIIGAGNSGVDIACDAARSADHAAISMRRGYHFIPKHLFGIPADHFAASGPHMPMWITQRVFGAMLRVMNGDLTRLGLKKPDHRIFESHPILNTQLLHHLSHGDIGARPDVARFDGTTVHFTDGTSDEFDLVLCATGYRWDIPYVDPSHFTWKGNRPDLYLNLISRDDPTLYALGFMETNGGAYKLFDEMADLIARTIGARRVGGVASGRIDRLATDDRPDLSGGIRFVGSDRHSAYVEITAYRRYLAKLRDELGWPTLTDGVFDHLRTDATFVGAPGSDRRVPA
ncbi:MAG: flavin-containing monooxygenase [Acidimicrobiales bacterium]